MKSIVIFFSVIIIDDSHPEWWAGSNHKVKVYSLPISFLETERQTPPSTKFKAPTLILGIPKILLQHSNLLVNMDNKIPEILLDMAV